MTGHPDLSARAAQFLYAYARAVDLGDLSALRSMLTDDILLTRADGTRQGPEAFLDVYRDLAAAPDSRKHAVTNVRAFREAGGEIRVEAYFQATFYDADRIRMIFGRYSDSLREEGDELRFAHKRNIVERVVSIPSMGV